VGCLALVLAGCTAPAQPPATTPPAESPTPTAGDSPSSLDATRSASEEGPAGPEVQRFQGTSQGVRVQQIAAIQGGDSEAPFELPQGTTALVVEVAWEGSEGLHVSVRPPCEASEFPLPPSCPPSSEDHSLQSPVRIVVEDGALLGLSGSWTLITMPDANLQGIPWNAWVSAFTSGPAPADYTAVGG
jgi:hypothetical protein